MLYRMKDQSYWSTRISSNSKLSRKLWKDFDVLMLQRDDELSPTCEDFKQASNFMDFFVDKIEQIKVTTSGAPPPVFTDHVGSIMETFQQTTTVYRAISEFNSRCSKQTLYTGSCANIACKTLFIVACAVSVQGLQSFSLGELPTDITERHHCHATA